MVSYSVSFLIAISLDASDLIYNFFTSQNKSKFKVRLVTRTR